MKSETELYKQPFLFLNLFLIKYLFFCLGPWIFQNISKSEVVYFLIFQEKVEPFLM